MNSKIKHGGARLGFRSPEYITWGSMKQRCLNSKNTTYPNYGGRGITICERWINSFENFLEDMGVRPNGCSLDRINNEGNYCPENCRWATSKVQRINQRKRKKSKNIYLITYNGKTQGVVEWAKELGCSFEVLYSRISRGWPLEDVVSIPIGNKGSRYSVRKNTDEIQSPSNLELEQIKEAMIKGAISYENQCKVVKAFDELIQFRKINE